MKLEPSKTTAVEPGHHSGTEPWRTGVITTEIIRDLLNYKEYALNETKTDSKDVIKLEQNIAEYMSCYASSSK